METAHLPLQNPVEVFLIILLIILFAPLLFNKLRIPGIIGLIVAGAAIGPHGFNLLKPNDTTLFGTVGLLYIMFLAGLEIDLADFVKNKNRSITFGLLTFAIPLILGLVVCFYLLNLSLGTSVLLAGMLSTHTMIAYPIASRLDIIKNPAVSTTVGGTMITDSLALIILAIIIAAHEGSLNILFWIRLVISFTIFFLLISYIFPIIARWMFRNLGNEGILHYIFVLLMVFTAGFLAELADLEPIIGAFLAGLALNRLIPHTSILMNRIEFVGNALFIPFFLIGVGMLIDFSVLFTGSNTIIMTLTLSLLAIGSKWLAAYFTQLILKFTVRQRNVVFGLSSAHAAATIAIILVGYKIGLADDTVLNAIVLLIFITCIFSSIVTERAAKSLAGQDQELIYESVTGPGKILVPIANPATIQQLVDFSLMIRNTPDDLIYPLTVVIDDEFAQDKVYASQKVLKEAVKYGGASNNVLYPVSRIDLNVPLGINRTIKELMITQIVIGWNGRISTLNKIFGSILDQVLENSRPMIIVPRLLIPLNTLHRIKVAIPETAIVEPGFKKWFEIIKNLAYQLTGKLELLCPNLVFDRISQLNNRQKLSVLLVHHLFDNYDQLASLVPDLKADDLLIVYNSRKNHISYRPFLDKIPYLLATEFEQKNFIIIYPEQTMEVPYFNLGDPVRF